MKKAVILLAVVITTLFTTLNAQTYYLYLWKGDYRMGLSAGGSYGINGTMQFIPQQYSSLTEVEGSFKRGLSPIISLYFGRERKLNSDNLHFGFDGSFGYSADRWSVEFKDTNNNITTAKVKSPNIRFEEGVYMSYLPNPQIAINAGGYIYENFILSSSEKFETVDEDGDEAPNPIEEFSDDDFVSSGFGFGVMFKVGMTYYFNETFFAAVNAQYSLPLLSSATFFGEESDTNPSWGDGVEYIQKNKLSNIGIVFTIGFRFTNN